MTSGGIKTYLSLIKFSHTVFALPFAIIGYFVAVDKTGNIDFAVLAFVVLAMIFARSAAMAFNRYLDRDIDKLNPRTKNREIPSGKISPRKALLFTVINSVLFIAVTYFINDLVFYLSPVALFVILFYSYTKRFTSFAHFVLGVGLGLAPIGAYLCVIQRFDTTPVLLSFLVLTWVSGFDIIYALQDEEFDRKYGLKSIPAILGMKKSIWLSIVLHLISAAIIVYIGVFNAYGWLYWIGAGIFIFFLIYQHVVVGKGDLSRINLAFFTANGISSLVYMIFYLAELLFG